MGGRDREALWRRGEARAAAAACGRAGASRRGCAQPVLYRWRYDREAEGLAFIVVDSRGHGRVGFEFILREPIEGQRLGAAAVLVGKDGRALHTFYARADTIGGTFAGGARHRHISLSAARAPAWWGEVEAVAFFNMRYYPQQKLGDAEVWQAMRRAVGHVWKGQGTEQRGGECGVLAPGAVIQTSA